MKRDLVLFTIEISEPLCAFMSERARALGHENPGGYIRRLVRQDQKAVLMEQLRALPPSRLRGLDNSAVARATRHADRRTTNRPDHSHRR